MESRFCLRDVIKSFDRGYFLGKNVLSILPRYEEKEWMSELKNGLIPTVFDRKELVNKLINLSRTEKKHFKK